MGIFKEALTAVQSACEALSEGETRDYTLKEVAAKCGGKVGPDSRSVIVNGVTVIMDGDPRWVEAGHQYALFKQHWPALAVRMHR